MDLEARARHDRKRVPLIITTILTFLDSRMCSSGYGNEARLSNEQITPTWKETKLDKGSGPLMSLLLPHITFGTRSITAKLYRGKYLTDTKYL